MIIERQRVMPPKIHGLVDLANRAGLAIPAGHQPHVDRLNSMSVPTRYPDGRRTIAATLTPQSTTALYLQTVELAQWLKQQLI